MRTGQVSSDSVVDPSLMTLDLSRPVRYAYVTDSITLSFIAATYTSGQDVRSRTYIFPRRLQIIMLYLECLELRCRQQLRVCLLRILHFCLDLLQTKLSKTNTICHFKISVRSFYRLLLPGTYFSGRVTRVYIVFCNKYSMHLVKGGFKRRI